MSRSVVQAARELRASVTPEISAEFASAAPRARILLVDDDKRNLLALSEVLDDLADTVCASSGEEALRFLLKEQFAVIILDVLMPGLDGYDTAKLLRGREQSRDTPVIFLSAINKEEQHLLRGYDIGAVDYVFKPFDPLVLRSKVNVFVSLYEKTREVERKAEIEQRLLEEKLVAVEALRLLEERQAVILASLPLAVYVREGLDGSPRFVTGNLEALTGFDANAFSADASLWASRIHPDDQLSMASNGASREFRFRHANGDYRYLLDQSVVLADPGMTAGTIRDVTEHRQLQHQLLQAQKMDAIGKLTGGIAHDFNNLLASVLSGLSLIERRVQLNDKTREIFEMTRHAAEQGKQLVSRMLAFSRRQSLTAQPVDLVEASRALNGLLTPVLGGLIHLEWDLDQPLWPVLADPPQLELAIMNLVINARDAMPDGGTISVRIRNVSKAGIPRELDQGSEYVVIRVADTGKGIPPHLLSQVIEPFFTTKETGKGTGLGLSTAYGFAKQSGGTLQIESTVGVGTNVDIWLPRSEDRPISHAVLADSPPQEMPRGPARILLVDDNASLRGLTEAQLIDEGYDVVSAAGGAEALALIERDNERFDVIVTDFAMPLISGLEVIKYARAVRANWPAIIITGHADAAKIAERPADVPLLTKPFTATDLVKAISLVASAPKS